MRTIIFTLILMLLSSCSGKEKNKALEDAAILCMVLDNTPCKKTEVKPGPVEVKPVPERTELSFILSNPKAVESEIVSFSDPFGGLLTSCERNSKILLAVYGKEISGCDFSNLARESKDWLGQAIEELSKRIFEKEIPEFLDKALKEAIKSGEEAVIAFFEKKFRKHCKGGFGQSRK